MKTSVALVLTLPVLLSACGGGSSDLPMINITAASNDPPPVPIVTEPLPVPTQNPDPEPVNETVIAPGELAELFGRVGFGFAFDGSQIVSSMGVEFSSANLTQTNDGAPVLFSTTRVNVRLTPDAEPLIGPEQTFGCGFVPQIQEFLCVLDVLGEDQTFFSFSRIVDNQARGAFEFCDGATIEECTTELIVSPDGELAVVVNNQLALASRTRPGDSIAADPTPYLQYLDQGTSTAGNWESDSAVRIGALTNVANQL